MFHLRSIRSLDDPELQPYLTMRRTIEHRQQRIFVAEGEKVVRRLLESSFGVVSVLITDEWLEKLKPILEGRREDIATFVAPKKVLEKLTGFSFYQGLLAVGKVPDERTLAEILEEAERPRLLVAIDQLSSAENLGVVVRNCAAFNASALLIGKNSTSPFLRRAVRSSMGAIFRIPVIENLDLPETLAVLRRSGIRSYAAHPRPDAAMLSQAELDVDCCLLFGSEGFGISPPALAACDRAFAIPMARGVDSLNVHTASAIFLYEAFWQRGQDYRKDRRETGDRRTGGTGKKGK